jgi:putative glutamine amidotransferase
MINQKPKIAVTNPDSSGNMTWLFTALNVKLAGGKPVRIHPKNFNETMDFDGVILGGGSDVHPNNAKIVKAEKVERSSWLKFKEFFIYPIEFFATLTGGGGDNLPRDKMEIQIIDHAINNDLPILGICRGHQLLNAKLGGSLHSSTLPFYKNKMRIRTILPRKEVLSTKRGSIIDDIADENPIKFNALHSQAVAKLDDGLESTGKNESGMNQVIESEKSNKILGVQWHPEYLIYRKFT